ncbi:hypothetical protein [Paracoccus sp. NSM]|uniref:hypothetical protein n=1 Tax=Paracoccus sp. NSM TaxID=3457784 RepID=UPI00403724D1
MPFPDGTALDEVLGGRAPDLIRSLLRPLTTEGVTETAFDGGVLYAGTLKSAQTDPLVLGFGKLHLPGVTSGIGFRLALFDDPRGRWHLDLLPDRLSLALDDLHAADLIPEQGTMPRRLVRRLTDTQVVITGEAVLRLARASASDGVVVLFVDHASSSDPLAATGPVVSLRCTPPHFYLGGSQFALTVSDLIFDASPDVTPAFITAQGQGPEWMGLAIAEATFFAPPNAIGQGGFSAGLRNLLLGAPRGIQGELEVQWGRSPLAPSTFTFVQDGQGPTGATADRVVALTGGQDRPVGMAVAIQAASPPEGSWSVIWRWPDGTTSEGANGAGQVRHGQILRAVPQEVLPSGRRLTHPEISFRFVSQGDAPQIGVTAGGVAVDRVVQVSGPDQALAGLVLRAGSTAPQPGAFAWHLSDEAPAIAGASLTLSAAMIADAAPTGHVILRETDAQGRVRQARLRLDRVQGKPLLIGTESGVIDGAAPAAPLALQGVEDSFDLTDFHASGAMRQSGALARADAARPSGVDVPAGVLAQVTLAEPLPPLPVEHDRHVQVLFQFANGIPAGWGEMRPARAEPTASSGALATQIRAWAANYPGATFLAIGRCDDLGSDDLNKTLARSRVATVLDILNNPPAGSGQAAIEASRITHWGEQEAPGGGGHIPPLAADERAADRLIETREDRTGWPGQRNTAHASETLRASYRRVDLYAIGGTPLPAAIRGADMADERQPSLRRMLVPGLAAAPVPAPVSTPATDKRLKLVVAWDKPSGAGWRDLIPSKAQFEYAWTPASGDLPDLGGQPVDLGSEVITIYGSWSHDDATDFTRSQIGIRSDNDPDALIRIDSPHAVAAMALGPMLLSDIDATTGAFEGAGRVAALVGATAFARTDLGGGPLLGDDSRALIKSVEAMAEFDQLADPGQGYKVALTVDYTTVLHVNTGAMGLRTDPASPVKIRYKKVGLRYDSRASDFWNRIGLEYPTDAMEIEDPGRWQIDGPLRDMLRAVETAMGVGSLWIETRFAFALNIGVVEISEAVIRVTFTGASPIPAFSLRGLVAKLDIPATVKGEGRLRIEDGGVIKAGIDLEVIPLKLKASAAFAMQNVAGPPAYTFVNLFAKVQFPAGIPLGPSGAALHGFVGQTVINGRRDVAPGTDVVKREIGWWQKPPEDKYRAERGQHALGLGAVVGTLPDASFALSAQGMLVVAFPSPEVIFGVEVKLLSVPDRVAREAGGNPDAAIIGLVVIDDQAVSLAVSARYGIPGLFAVQAPFSARFPYDGRGNYVRLGSDGHEGRSGEPVTLTLLPGTLDLRAFAYLMIEQDRLHKLGGRSDFSFDGFSVGFGAGASLNWKAGPIKLNASALILAGLGTDPVFVRAGIFVQGRLDLVVVSIGARGEILLTLQDGRVWMKGEFCGKVRLMFFKVQGCVRFRIGNEAVEAVAPPPPPVASVVLTDRRGQIMGEATAAGTPQGRPIFDLVEQDGRMVNRGADPRDNHTVWADTAPVVNFRHFVEDADTGGQFRSTGQPSGAVWFGSNRLKYAYRMTRIRLVQEDGTPDGRLVSGVLAPERAWVTSPARQPGSGGAVQPSGAEVHSLKLLDWQPWGWAVPMADGGAGQPGDPVQGIDDLCRAPAALPVACLSGADARRAGPYRIRLLPETPATGPYPSRFALNGAVGHVVAGRRLDDSALIARASAVGALVHDGAVIDLPQPVPGRAGPIRRGYRLPEAARAGDGGMTRQALPWLGDLDRPVQGATLLVLVCDGRLRPPARKAMRCADFAGLPLDTSHQSLPLPDFLLRARGSARHFTITDQVDARQGGAVLGADRQPDILITAPGLTIRPEVATTGIELHLWRAEARPTRLSWIDADGKRHDLTDPGLDKGAITLRAEAAAPILQLEIETEAKALHLYRLCHDLPQDRPGCVGFGRVKPDTLQGGRLALGGMEFAVIDPASRIGLADMVDLRGTTPRAGSDGLSELLFPDAGLQITPAAPWHSVTIGIRSGSGGVKVQGLAADGSLVAEAFAPYGDPVDLHLSSPAGIARLILRGGRNEAVIYRICSDDPTAERCHDFTGHRPGVTSALTLAPGLTLQPLLRGAELKLTDDLTEAQRILPRPDGRPELALPEGGVLISLPRAARAVTLHLVLGPGAHVRAEARDSRDQALAQAEDKAEALSLVRLRLEGPGMTRVLLEAEGMARLLRLCIEDDEGGTDEALPVVQTQQGQRAHQWPGRVLGRMTGPDGLPCRVVAYEQPSYLPRIDNFGIIPGAGHRVAVLSLCASDGAAADARARDAEARAGLRDRVAEAAGAPPAAAVARPILLDPGQTYRIEVDWSWQAWRSNAAGTNAPPPRPLGAWQTGGRQSFRFRTADRDLASGAVQDGLNEHVFDARDLARYLARTEPADGRDTVFTDDPVWAHFTAGHVENLAARHGRKLTIALRRSDPPPSPDAAARLAATRPALIQMIRAAAPQAILPMAEQRINRAVAEAPCLPDGPVTGGLSLGARHALEPRAMYDLRVLAPRLDDSDPVEIAATRFVTSAHASPQAMMTAMGFDADGGIAPLGPKDMLINGVLPSGGLILSDQSLLEALTAFGADTLPLPQDGARVIALWRQGWTTPEVAGILIDSPEPLRREAAVLVDGQAVPSTRCAPDHLAIGGTRFDPVRASFNWTRVLFVPATPVAPAPDAVLSFGMTVTPGGLLTGRRIMQARPLILDTEGF